MQTNSQKLSPQNDRELLLRKLQSIRDEEFSNLTAEQHRLWLFRQLDPIVPTHVFNAVELRGKLVVPVLEQSAGDLLRRHGVLRSTFVDLGRGPQRIVAESANLNLNLCNAEGLSEDQYQQELEKIAGRDSRQPFDLRSAPLIRLTLVRHSDTRHVLMVTMHELVADLPSTVIFISELLRSYEAEVFEEQLLLPDYPKEFSALARQEHEWLKTVACENQLNYWREALAEISVLDLPLDYTRPPIKTFESESESRSLSSLTLAALEHVSQREGVPMQVLLLAAFNALLYWYSGHDDLAIGVPGDRDHDCGIGPLTNTLAIRTDLSGNPTFLELLHRVHDQVGTGRVHQRIPFAKLVDELQPKRDVSRTPLVQAEFVTLDRPFRDLRPQSLKLTPLYLNDGNGLLDMTLHAVLDDDPKLILEYNSDLFQPETIRRMLANLQLILNAITQDVTQSISRLMALPDAEGPDRSMAWNQTEREFPEDKCIHELIEDQVERSPDSVAVVWGEEHLTYRELNVRADLIANRLRQHAIQLEAMIGICLNRSPETIVTLLAVLKAGGAYITLDPELPSERLNFMLRDGEVQAILTRREFLGKFQDTSLPVILLDDPPAPTDTIPKAPNHRVTSANLAYIIYTSGSTGTPKGVAVTHKSVVNNLTWRQSMWPLTAADRVMHNFSFNWDPSLWATFWPLLAGGCVLLMRSAKHFDSMALARLLLEERVTVCGGAPSMYTVLAEERGTLSRTALRHLFSGGEILDAETQSGLHASTTANLYNVYGPTEATIDSTYWSCSRDGERKVAPIGLPIANTRIYLLKTNLEMSLGGVVGEIFVSGVGLARGYVGHPGFTAEKFLPDPFSATPGSRMYRTGDLGRQRQDEVFEFVGRSDEQVKVRGYRIELGEIERTLLLHESVRESSVIVTRSSSEEPRITAYVAMDQGPDAPSSADLALFLKVRLPSYMIPDLFVVLDALPRTSAGKLDKRALPVPDSAQAASEGFFIAPRTALEMEISQVVGPVLGLERVSVEADLFSLGCNSLLMARIASRLSSAYQLNLPVNQLFKDPTVAGLSRIIESHQSVGQPSAVKAWTMEQLEAEAVLDPTIVPGDLPRADHCSPASIFLTGVTGYLGAFILKQLLADTKADVYCLVRASDSADGLQRIQENITRYSICDDGSSHRIHPVVGDLAKPRFGLSESAFAELAGTVDAIYHCGALVNFVYPYSALKPVNVSGTHEILRLACREKLKVVHHISTVDVFLGAHFRRPFHETDEALISPPESPDGYARSKWVAEKMVANARSRGVPVCVYRPGLIMGHTETGATQTNDYLLLGLKGYIDLGVLPEPLIMIDFVTVDYVAKAITHLSRQPDSIGKYFHIWNPRSVHMSKAYEWIRSFGYDLPTVPASVLRQHVQTVDASNALYPFVAGFQGWDGDPAPSPSHDPSVLERINVYEECTNTFRGLKDSGIECPPLTEDLAHLCLSYLRGVDFLPTPKPPSQSGVASP